jgi:homocysteine S-methyltransferase
MDGMVFASTPRPVVIDGGLGTHLEARGHDLSSSMWSARLLLEHPDEVAAVHDDFFAAGARVAISASYQASVEGFGRLGLDRAEAERLMRVSVQLAIASRDRVDPSGWVAASVGPYGATLADGSEYRGDYALDEAQLRAWHAPRLAVLADEGADLLAFETIPSRAESRALIDLVRGTGVPAWLSFTVHLGMLRTGEPLEQAFADADAVDEIVAVGINCSHPSEVLGAIAAARRVTAKPVVVYPNSGEEWDAKNRVWVGEPGFPRSLVEQWVVAGAALVGGCCRVGPADIAQLAAHLAHGGRATRRLDRPAP